jgi:hypothetical protein
LVRCASEIEGQKGGAMTGNTAPQALSESDLKMFARFGIEPFLLAEACVRRVTDVEALDSYGIRFDGNKAGIVFPYLDPMGGARWTARLRRDNPETDSDGKPENKYLSAWGDNRHLYFPPNAGKLLADVSVPVVVVEAEKSALALAALAGRDSRPLLPIATGGCWGWRGKTGIEGGPNGEHKEVRGPLPDLDRISWGGRRAVIVPDSNVATNPDVAAARQALAVELEKRGARVCLASLPQEPTVNGPDDFIAAHGGDALLSLIDHAEEWRPFITLKPGEYPLAVDEAEEILRARSLKIFQRAGEVVRVITLPNSKHGDGLRREPGTVQLVPVGNVALTEVWDRLIEWQKLKATRGGFKRVRIDCPGRIAAAYLSRIGSWRLPSLTGIISAPIMRLDGTVLRRAGYDDETGLFLTEDWPDFDDNPSRADALAALRRIQEPFAEFPFVAAEDLSVVVAGTLTAIQRRLLRSAPLFGFSAPTQRTGKSLLSECLSIIATGRPAPAMAVSGDREEMRKAVAAALREGHSVVNLDNVEHPLASPDLSRAVTQSEYADRVLGETRILRLPTNILWTVTGNNLAFRGDLAVRALVSRLDARLERPEERKFRIADLKAHIAEHRRELVTAAVNILRAYVVAGRPDQALPAWGGFDEWTATIREPLVWLGAADPCATRQHVIEDDPDREQAAALLSAWHSAVGGEAIQIADLLERAASRPELASALRAVAAHRDDSKQIDPRRLGWWCRAYRDRVVESLRLERGKDYGGRATWKVSPVSEVRNPSTKAPGAVEEEFGWPENNRTDRSNRKNGQDGTGEATLFNSEALEI